MKTLRLFVGTLVAACALTSCGYDDFYSGTDAAGTFTPYGPPTYGSPFYVSALSGIGSPSNGSIFYRYGPSYAGRTISYRRIPSPRGSYHYIYHDSAEPLPPPGTPMKATTWRYTSRYPSIWGAPVWVTTYTPKLSSRWVRAQ
jgi:hypothetical protein